MEVAVPSPVAPDDSSPVAATLDYAPTPKKSLGSLAASGAAWTFGAYAFGQVFRLASNLVLTRLLAPNLFGLMALVQTILTGVHMFADIGVGPAIIQRSHGREELYLHTAYSVQAIRGFIVWLIGCLIAIPAAWLYNDPMLPSLIWVIPIVAFTAAIDGLQSTSLFTLNRDMSFKAINLVEIGSQVFGTTLMILIAWRYPTIWALIIGTLAGTFGRTALSHLLYRLQRGNPFRDRFAWDRAAAADLLGFGRWITLSSATTFMAMQMDRLVLAKLIGLAAFGVYNIAVMLATVASSAVVRVGQAVVFPAFSRVLNENGTPGDGSLLHGPFRKARRIMLVGGGFCVAGVAGTGPNVVAFLYDQRYQEGGVFVSLLAISAWFQILDVCNAAALLAHGRAKWVATGNVAKLIGLVLFLPAGYMFHGVYGAIIGIGLADMAKYLTSAYGLRRHGLNVLGGDAIATAYFAAVAVAVFAVLHQPAANRLQRFGDISLGFAMVAVAAGALFLILTRAPGAETSEVAAA